LRQPPKQEKPPNPLYISVSEDFFQSDRRGSNPQPINSRPAKERSFRDIFHFSVITSLSASNIFPFYFPINIG
jgi:hypothetical protein